MPRRSPPVPPLLDLLPKEVSPETGPALRDRPRSLAHDQLLLERLEIENFWSYRKATVQFEPGITVIAGPNGSGKSSLLESIFFALYGSEARHVIGRNLDEILRIGAESGSVRLDFSYSGRRYTAQIALRRHKGATKSERDGCQLSCEDGTVWLGVEDVTAEIERLFGMDRDGFTNCVYVRQGEIDKLIRADRKTREQMLDGLLGLYKLDLYVSPRAKEAQRALNRRAEVISARIARLRAEIESLEGQELGRQKQQLTEKIEAVHAQLKELDEQRADAYKRLQIYEEEIKRFQQTQQEAEQTQRELKEKERRLAQRESERRALEAELEALEVRQQKAILGIRAALQKWDVALSPILNSLERATAWEEICWLPGALSESRQRVESQRERVRELRESEVRLATERAQHERNLAEWQEQRRELMKLYEREERQLRQHEAQKAQTESLLRAQERQINEMLMGLRLDAQKAGVPSWGEKVTAGQIAQWRAAWAERLSVLEGQGEQARRAVFEARTQCDLLRRASEEKQKLLAEGRCPTCGQPVTAEHLAKALEEFQPRLAELERLVHEEEAALRQIEEKLARWRAVQKQLDRLIVEMERLQARQQEAALQERAISEGQERLTALHARLAELDQRIENERAILAARQSQHEELRAQLKSAHQEFEESLARQQKLEDLKSEVEQWLRQRAHKREKQGAHKALLESLNELRGDVARLQDRLAQLRARLRDQSESEHKKIYVQQRLEQLQQQRAAVQQEYEELAQRRGMIQSQLEHLEKLRAEHDQALQEQARLERLQTELAEIVSIYQTTKVELRKRNLEALNYYFNEFFALMDSGDSYRRVRVRDDYEIEVELKSGRKLNPALLSGGERALTNIALRCAIHQVLAKAVRRMPLILDEPTIYLDRDRIHRLQFLLEDLGKRVGQVIVVSHEVGLVEGADHEYRTEKGSDNISIIYKVR
ncbi:MAG: AAA family ATPase [Candidatus Bipolaricaulota bacterium]|nr:AAA family ATPase [Candidatus Bipolaricaulota bacterium]MCS7274717.1 AAA family ATPase [Candidatus Bipolaricaulota bacterium]MDW8109994.1 AAA family ATPase [Candidatus Bipolaricaulota bacterium]MDW8328934.1 AAA family ATPase [Candidatus Bipolaricaulota bacterium]